MGKKRRGNSSEKSTASRTAKRLTQEWAVSAQSVEISCCAAAKTRTVGTIAVVESFGALRGHSAKVAQAAVTEKQDGRDPSKTTRTTINGSESREQRMEMALYGANAQLTHHLVKERRASENGLQVAPGSADWRDESVEVAFPPDGKLTWYAIGSLKFPGALSRYFVGAVAFRPWSGTGGVLTRFRRVGGEGWWWEETGCISEDPTLINTRAIHSADTRYIRIWQVPGLILKAVHARKCTVLPWNVPGSRIWTLENDIVTGGKEDAQEGAPEARRHAGRQHTGSYICGCSVTWLRQTAARYREAPSCRRACLRTFPRVFRATSLPEDHSHLPRALPPCGIVQQVVKYLGELAMVQFRLV
ncbi:hypothetical protein DFH06DRAFT_1138004 [Mycena polygramma]|nr:hypothetical protein DFH06DRAFT_1138004 [Mycena polygramma]